MAWLISMTWDDMIESATCKLVNFMANLSIAFLLVVMNTTIGVIESSHLHVTMLQL